MFTRGILATFALCLLSAGAQEPTPRIDEQPAKIPQLYLPSFDLPQQGQLVITMIVCPAIDDSPECQISRAAWQRVRDEVDLHNLLFEDLRNQKKGSVNIALRDRISALAARIAKNKYE